MVQLYSLPPIVTVITAVTGDEVLLAGKDTFTSVSPVPEEGVQVNDGLLDFMVQSLSPRTLRTVSVAS